MYISRRLLYYAVHGLFFKCDCLKAGRSDSFFHFVTGNVLFCVSHTISLDGFSCVTVYHSVSQCITVYVIINVSTLS